MYELLTNEWLPAEGNKWPKRKVLCLFSDGWMEVCSWVGWYWTNQHNQRVEETIGHRITHFYIYDKFNENDIV